MNEIELKAHVRAKDDAIKKLNDFAEYRAHTIKNDFYYAHPSNEKLKIRIRKEETDGKTTNLLTYKKKETQKDGNGVIIEVNNEQETEIADAKPLVSYLEDCGFKIYLRKTKDVMSWNWTTENHTANIELCNVEKLGYFLEVEILSEKNDSQTVSHLREKLLEILTLAGIDRKDIEPRYYSELLRETETN